MVNRVSTHRGGNNIFGGSWAITPTPTVTPSTTLTPTPSTTLTPTPSVTNTPTNTVTPTNTLTPTPTPTVTYIPPAGPTGNTFEYTTGTYFDVFTSRNGITSNNGFNTNNGCWQLFYAHQEVTISTGANRIGLNTHWSGNNTWTWYVSVSTVNNTIGSFGTVSAITNANSFSYTAGGFNQSAITVSTTIPAGRYFLLMNSDGPFYRTVRSLTGNRTGTVSGSPYVTALNKVYLGNWPTGGTTLVPTQLGGSGTNYTEYSAHVHVCSVIFT
jgi:hypothetical protein